MKDKKKPHVGKVKLFQSKSSWVPSKVGVIFILLTLASLQYIKADSKLLHFEVPKVQVAFKTAAWELFKFCTITVGLDWTLDEMKVQYVKAWENVTKGMSFNEVDKLAKKVKLEILMNKYPDLRTPLSKWKTKTF